MKKKISLLLSLVLIVSFSLMACGDKESNSIDSIKESGKLVIGTSPDYPPFEFVHNGEIVGLDIELAKYIAKELDVELEIKEMDFSNLLNGFSTGMVDLVIAGMNPSETNKKGADFSDLYYESDFSILVKKDNTSIKSEKDLQGSKIGAQLGTTQEKMAEAMEGVELVSLKTNPDIVMNLKTDKILAGIMETPVAKSFAAANADLKVVEGLELKDETGGMAIATKKGNTELVDKVNEILKDVKSQDLVEKWFVEAQKLSEDNPK